jgi:hypothetical protein
MFYDREDCTKLSFFPDDYGTPSGVFLFKGFYTDEECRIVEDALKDYNYDGVYEQTLISWYADKLSPPIVGLFKLWEKASELLYPEYVIHPQNNVLIIDESMKQGMFTHSDSPGKGECHRLSQVDVWKTCCELDYGLVAYFGNFEGGEVFYVNINEDGTKKDPDINSKIFNDHLKNDPANVELITVLHSNYKLKNVTKEDALIRVDYVIDEALPNIANTQLNDFKWVSAIKKETGENNSLYESVRNALQEVKPTGVVYSYFIKLKNNTKEAEK